MPLWERYQQCLVTTDPTELVLIIDQFEYVMLAGAEPPVLDEGVGSSRDEPTAPYGGRSPSARSRLHPRGCRGDGRG